MSSAFRFRDIFVQGVQDPYPFYHWLRTEAPVYWNAEIVPLGSSPATLIGGHHRG